VKYGHVVTVRQSSGRSGVYMKERKKKQWRMTIDVEAKDRNETASNITGTYRNCKLKMMDVNWEVRDRGGLVMCPL
jgi:SRSO17 transposase